MVHSYKEAGVDIEKGDSFAEFIKNIKSPAVLSGIGSFSGGMELDLTKYKNPVILTATDGVGTKLLVARHFNDYSTVGIDLVAMCVNDLICNGADPVLFLDYIACGRFNEEKLKTVVKGIIKGCEISGCKLAGGETAEMPDMYSEEDIDLAGFSVGIVEKTKMLPFRDQISRSDILLGIPSSGIHSNGLSLARKVLDKNDWKDLLVPTRIYVQEIKKLLKTGKILGLAHITGGGLKNNIRRILPNGYDIRLNFNWPVPEVFSKIARKVKKEEMEQVFNLGIGMVLAVKKFEADLVNSFAKENKINLIVIGEII